MVKVNKNEVKMSILDELSNPIRQIDAETATNARSERSRGRTQRKAYKYYVAVKSDRMGLQCERLKDGYVHHEATHAKSLNSEEINPNPNSTDKQPIYLKRPAKHPKNFFRSFNHDWKNPKE